MSGTDGKGVPLPEIRKLWDFQDPAATEAKFREVLPAARASGDRARCLRSLGRTAEALGIQEELRTATEGAGDPDGFVFEELGECLLALGRREEARPRFGQAWDLLSKDPWLACDEPGRLERLKRLAAGAAE